MTIDAAAREARVTETLKEAARLLQSASSHRDGWHDRQRAVLLEIASLVGPWGDYR